MFTVEHTSSSALPSLPLLRVENLAKHFPIKKGLLMRTAGTVKAVDGVSFAIFPGSTLGLVGESGCGKSTLGRTIIRLYEPSSGEVHFQQKNFTQLKGEELRLARRDIQMIFQDPYASLDPRMTVAQILEQPFRIHNLFTAAERTQKVRELLSRVGLRASHLNRYPHEFSGGQRQRISIARALALQPKLIIADEAVSALDVSIQAQILNLMKDLQTQLGLTYLFISHDLGVIDHMCDTIAVMYLGKIVELSPREDFLRRPLHPYTQALLSAIPKFGQGKKSSSTLRGDVPSPINPPSGCAFHPRCPHKMDICSQRTPPLQAAASAVSKELHTDAHRNNYSLQPNREGHHAQVRHPQNTQSSAARANVSGSPSDAPQSHRVACWLHAPASHVN